MGDVARVLEKEGERLRDSRRFLSEHAAGDQRSYAYIIHVPCNQVGLSDEGENVLQPRVHGRLPQRGWLQTQRSEVAHFVEYSARNGKIYIL